MFDPLNLKPQIIRHISDLNQDGLRVNTPSYLFHDIHTRHYGHIACPIDLCSNIQQGDTSNTRLEKNMKTMALITAVFFTAIAGAEEQVRDEETYFPQQMTAKELLNACASSAMSNRGRQSRKFCEGFISGVEETLRLQSMKQSSNDSKLLCVHKGKSASNFADMYIAYASRRKSLDAPAASIVIAALQAAYPCKH